MAVNNNRRARQNRRKSGILSGDEGPSGGAGASSGEDEVTARPYKQGRDRATLIFIRSLCGPRGWGEACSAIFVFRCGVSPYIPLMTLLDPIVLAQSLIRRPSVTPLDAGAMDVLEAALKDLGFSCRRMPFGEGEDRIENLYAHRTDGPGPNLCFAGHTDVVPVGDEAAWKAEPFGAGISEGVLVGRGAVDMKGAIAAFVAAVSRLDRVPGTLSFLITGDEEGIALYGTKPVVKALIAEGVKVDHCIVGEPTSAGTLGDMMKVGRRGSINAWIEVQGRQGHVAYPQRAKNPIPALLDLLGRYQARLLDEGYEDFQPSNLEITTIDVENTATNIIPNKAKARLNIRFNPAHTGDALEAWFRAEAAEVEAAHGVKIELRVLCSGEAFLTRSSPFVDVLAGAITEVTGQVPDRSTTGGTSDARFIRELCPVVEFGLVGTTMHQVNEAVPVSELLELTDVYERMITRYFAAGL